MSKALVPVLILLLFSSCVTYQYFTVDSLQVPKDAQQSFSLENDTMRLTYSFASAGGAMTVTVFNKTSQPLFINWSKSALICNDQSYSLAQGNSSFVASSVRTGYGVADLAGTVNVNPTLEIIPAQTKVSRTPINLNVTLPLLRIAMPDSSQKQQLHLDDGGVLSYWTLATDETHSPLRMKTYLTFVIGPGNGTEFTESHSFYIGKVMQTRYDPNIFKLYHEGGSQFYIMWDNGRPVRASSGIR